MIILSVFFKETIKNVATDLGFNFWDWLAVLIAICSLFVGLRTLIVSMKTLRSQQNTESNTQPIITPEIQKSLLADELKGIFECYCFLFALYFNLKEWNFGKKPSKHFWNYISVKSNFHEDIFYDSEVKLQSFRMLISACENLYSDFANLRYLLEQPIAYSNSKIIENEFKRIFSSVPLIISSFYSCLSNTFLLADKDIYNFITNNFFDIRNECRFVRLIVNKHSASAWSIVGGQNSHDVIFSPIVTKFCNEACRSWYRTQNKEYVDFDFKYFGSREYKYSTQFLFLSSNIEKYVCLILLFSNIDPIMGAFTRPENNVSEIKYTNDFLNQDELLNSENICNDTDLEYDWLYYLIDR